MPQIGEALYTFTPEEDTEIQINEGEQVVIFDDDVGEGWVDGKNVHGNRGIFPKNYIRVTADITLEEAEAFPETPSSHGNGHVAINGGGDYAAAEKNSYGQASPNNGLYEEPPVDDDWGDVSPAKNVYTGQAQANDPPSYSTNPPAAQTAALSLNAQSTSTTQNSTQPSYTEDDESVSAFLGRYFNRFTYFVKSQAEDYILGILQTQQKQATLEDSLYICKFGQEGPIWRPSQKPFIIQINNYCKGESRGLLTPHLYYQISKDSQPNREVKRKYEHFEWLLENFRRKFPVAILPALPARVPTEEVQLQRQIRLLNIWATQISNNPMLQQSKLVEHFVTIEDKKLYTKARKQCDQDKVVLGANFKVVDIEHGAHVSISNLGEIELNRSKKVHAAFTQQFESLCRGTGMMQDQYVKYISPSVTMLESSCKRLGDALVEHRTFGSLALGQAFQQTSEVFKDVNADIRTKPKNSYEDLSDQLWVHRKKLECWPNLFNINELALEKFKDATGMKPRKDSASVQGSATQQVPSVLPNQEQNCHDRLVEIVKTRCDRVVTTTQAEINHHTAEMVRDSKAVMQDYLRQQIEMHEQLVEKYRKALEYFDDVPDVL